MSDAIAPALTPEEWAAAEIEGRAIVSAAPAHVALCIATEPDCIELTRAPTDSAFEIFAPEAPIVVALLNAMLPNADPRKITWAMVDELRNKNLDEIADALASYLPPRDITAP